MGFWDWLRPFKKLSFGDLDEAEQARLRREYELYEEEIGMADEKDTQVQVEEKPASQAQEVAQAEVPVTDTSSAEKAPDAEPQTDVPVKLPEAVLVQEVEEDDSFDDIYAAAGMAFANSRATKAQRERELDGLEEDLPTAQAALATAKSEGQNVVQAATQRAQQMQADAEGEVKRIQDAIATKQAQIAKAENSDVEKASALIAVLQSYVATHSG